MKFALAATAALLFAARACAGPIEPQINGAPTNDDPSISVTELRPGATLAVWSEKSGESVPVARSVTHTLRIVAVVGLTAVLEIEHERREKVGDGWLTTSWSTGVGPIPRGQVAKIAPNELSRPVSVRHGELLEVKRDG